MCHFLSGWLNLETEGPEVYDLRSHSAAQEHFGWSALDLERRREWEWTADDDGASLVVRTLPDDQRDAAWCRALLLSRWPTRHDAIMECVAGLHPSVTRLDLGYATIPAGLVIPSSVTWLDLCGATIPAGLAIPSAARVVR